MGQRSKPAVLQEDIEKATNELLDVLDVDSLSDVDKFFALDLLNDYGMMAAMAEAAKRSILNDGLTKRETRGGKGNNHYSMVKSEAIDIYRQCVTQKIQLAVKISKFVKSGVIDVVEEDDGGLGAFLNS